MFGNQSGNKRTAIHNTYILLNIYIYIYIYSVTTIGLLLVCNPCCLYVETL